MTILGTRPEAIKLAPVLLELGRRKRQFRSILCVTGQHRELLDPMLKFFNFRPDYDLRVMRKNQSLSGLTARLLEALDPVLAKVRPDWIMVQGDTTTVMASALAAYYRGIRVAHVEAGLRTSNKRSPFPEEINRRMAGVLADVHFAPTPLAERNLQREGVKRDCICMTGNTVVDALNWAIKRVREKPPKMPADIPLLRRGRRLILVTGHRRENFGAGMEQICLALRDIADALPDVDLVYPVHLNPNVREPVNRLLAGQTRIHLADPVEYPVLVELLQRSWIILTDSGGIQEEAPTFGVPCLVMRDSTERPEGIQQGVAKLVGTDRWKIVAAVRHLDRDAQAYKRMASGENPYGDGKAAKKVVKWLEECK
ncbi:MAG TPA: UDP-N-acetylglucosamine 2-epimerase (non-hydrolyzing) [Kiritimatiellia bacterium]|nr:UDP-N-acetylglucosamine 2-epimerase (non-hydrolyzing) [Kiritimatiellia bacterium]